MPNSSPRRLCQAADCGFILAQRKNKRKMTWLQCVVMQCMLPLTLIALQVVQGRRANTAKIAFSPSCAPSCALISVGAHQQRCTNICHYTRTSQVLSTHDLRWRPARISLRMMASADGQGNEVDSRMEKVLKSRLVSGSDGQQNMPMTRSAKKAYIRLGEELMDAIREGDVAAVKAMCAEVLQMNIGAIVHQNRTYVMSNTTYSRVTTCAESRRSLLRR